MHPKAGRALQGARALLGGQPTVVLACLAVLLVALLVYSDAMRGGSSGGPAPLAPAGAQQPLLRPLREAALNCTCPLPAPPLPCPLAPRCPQAPLCPAPPPPPSCSSAPPPPQQQQPQPQPAAAPAAAPAADCEPIAAALARHVAYFMPLVSAGGLGHHDTGTVLPYMLRFFDAGRPALLIDIGANLGDTSAIMVKMFTDADCVRYQQRKPPQGMHEDCYPNLPVRIFAYEPVPENYALLAERGGHDQWPAVGWRGYQVALTSPAAIDALPALPSGARNIKFYGRLVNGAMVGGDQQGGLGPTNGVGAGEFINVEGWTLDGHLGSIGEGSSEVLLLKVDTEGFDAQTLLGAEGTLRAQRVVFLVFEYNDKWHAAADSIKPVSQWLLELGYTCFWITARRLVPMSGALWHDGYEFFAWSNVLCHRVSDAQAATLVSFFNGEVQRPVCAA